MFQMSVKTEWGDYFTGNSIFIQQKEFGTPQTPSATGVYVSNCLFKSITSGSNGGALSCTSATEMLVESSSFFSCRTSGNTGGAIYFSNTNNGQCVLYEVCGYDCCSTYTDGGSYGQFARINVNNVASSKNYVNYSSIAYCINEITSSYRALHLYNGKNICESVNISMNKCGYHTGVSCEPFLDSNSVTSSLIYSSFVDNNITGYTCIFLARSDTKHEIKSCNILRNTQGIPNTQGTICSYGYLIIENSCIFDNKANRFFHQSSSSCTITISNCTVDLIPDGRYLTIINTVTKNFIHALNHMSTRNCHSEYDSAEYLTPAIQSPSKKQMHCSCERNFYQSRLRELISLLSVFIINFIHFDIFC
jgi:hypothetical protein